MTKDEIIKALRDMAKYPTVTLPRDCEALRMAADLLAQPEHGWTPERIAGMARLKDAQDKRLAQPEQEPVACVEYIPCCTDQTCPKCKAATPPQRLPLTDEAKDAARYRWIRDSGTDVSLVIDKRTEWVPPDDVVAGVGGYWMYEYRCGSELDEAIDQAIEAKLKEKNT